VIHWREIREAHYTLWKPAYRGEGDEGEPRIHISVAPVPIPEFRWVQIPPPEHEDGIWILTVGWKKYQKILELKLTKSSMYHVCNDVDVPEQAQAGFAVGMKAPPVPDEFIEELVTWLHGA
jgi:hypothetical protein